MKRFNLILAAFAIIAVAVGCKPDPVLTLTTASDSAVTFEIPGGTKTITFNANYVWTAASSESWVTVSPASGNAEAGSITLTAAANATSSERTATVTITMETLKQTITCKQGAQVLKLSNSDDASWTIGKEEKTIAVDFISNLDWTAASSADWITVTPTSGKAATSAAEITLKVAANDTYDDRTGIVTVTSNGKTLGIEIKQSQTNSFAIVDDNDGYYWANQLGGEVDINIKANVDYTYTIDPDASWMSVTKGLVASKIALAVAYNDSGTYREAWVAVKVGDESDTLTVGQGASVWSMKLSSVIDVANSPNITTAQLGDYFIICTGDGTAPVLVDKATGEKKGTMDIGDMTFVRAIKNDDAGNILLCNQVSYDAATSWWTGNFQVYKTNSVTAAPTKIIDVTPSMPIGYKIQVRGDVNGTAVIAAATEAIPDISGTNTIYYWKVSGGIVSDAVKLDVTGIVGVGWYGGGYWFIGPDQAPALTPLSEDYADGFAFSTYDEDAVYVINPATGAATLIANPQSDGASWGYAYNSIEIRPIDATNRLAVLYGTSFFNYFNGEMFVIPESKLDGQYIGSTVDVLSVYSPSFTCQLDTNADGSLVDPKPFGGDVSMCKQGDYMYFYTVQQAVDDMEVFAYPLK